MSYSFVSTNTSYLFAGLNGWPEDLLWENLLRVYVPSKSSMLTLFNLHKPPARESLLSPFETQRCGLLVREEEENVEPRAIRPQSLFLSTVPHSCSGQATLASKKGRSWVNPLPILAPISGFLQLGQSSRSLLPWLQCLGVSLVGHWLSHLAAPRTEPSVERHGWLFWLSVARLQIPNFVV